MHQATLRQAAVGNAPGHGGVHNRPRAGAEALVFIQLAQPCNGRLQVKGAVVQRRLNQRLRQLKRQPANGFFGVFDDDLVGARLDRDGGVAEGDGATGGGLQLKRCELVAVERAVFDRWIAAGESLKIVMETKTAPGLSVAIKDGVKPGPVVLRAAMTESLGAVPGSEDAKVVALAKADFDYVATLGYFTPRSLPGVTLVEAKDVTQLMQSGGSYIDTRTEAEFKAGHVPGAKLVPYVEKSAKDADFKAEEDKFDITKLPSDKTSALIFACNGAECWKSFKASYAANKAGYTKVHWFRGGFPEWRAAGLKVETTP